MLSISNVPNAVAHLGKRRRTNSVPSSHGDSSPSGSSSRSSSLDADTTILRDKTTRLTDEIRSALPSARQLTAYSSRTHRPLTKEEAAERDEFYVHTELDKKLQGSEIRIPETDIRRFDTENKQYLRHAPSLVKLHKVAMSLQKQVNESPTLPKQIKKDFNSSNASLYRHINDAYGEQIPT